MIITHDYCCFYLGTVVLTVPVAVTIAAAIASPELGGRLPVLNSIIIDPIASIITTAVVDRSNTVKMINTMIIIRMASPSLSVFPPAVFPHVVPPLVIKGDRHPALICTRGFGARAGVPLRVFHQYTVAKSVR